MDFFQTTYEAGANLAKLGSSRARKTEAKPSHQRRLAMAKHCTHLNQITVTNPSKHVCEECVKIGDSWVHLRMCLECGKVGCCDSSKNKHATKHFHSSSHPLMRSIEPGERWIWCYVDEVAAGELES